MSRFSEIGAYKENVMIKLLSNNQLVKAIANNQLEFLDYPLSDELQNDVTKLLYDRVFPYKYSLQTVTEQKIIISVSFSNYRSRGNILKAGNIYFYVLVHKDLVRTPYGCLRFDYIVNKIDETFNSDEDIGVGKLEFNSMDELYYNDNFIGSVISYKVQDFN